MKMTFKVFLTQVLMDFLVLGFVYDVQWPFRRNYWHQMDNCFWCHHYERWRSTYFRFYTGEE